MHTVYIKQCPKSISVLGLAPRFSYIYTHTLVCFNDCTTYFFFFLIREPLRVWIYNIKRSFCWHHYRRSVYRNNNKNNMYVILLYIIAASTPAEYAPGIDIVRTLNVAPTRFPGILVFRLTKYPMAWCVRYNKRCSSGFKGGQRDRASSQVCNIPRVATAALQVVIYA